MGTLPGVGLMVVVVMGARLAQRVLSGPSRSTTLPVLGSPRPLAFSQLRQTPTPTSDQRLAQPQGATEGSTQREATSV